MTDMRAIRRQERKAKQRLRYLYLQQASRMLREQLRLQAAAGRKALRLQLLAADPRCHWCRVTLTRRTATLDHLHPVAKGGTDWPENLVLACSVCNTARGSTGIVDRRKVAALVAARRAKS